MVSEWTWQIPPIGCKTLQSDFFAGGWVIGETMPIKPANNTVSLVYPDKSVSVFSMLKTLLLVNPSLSVYKVCVGAGILSSKVPQKHQEQAQNKCRPGQIEIWKPIYQTHNTKTVINYLNYPINGPYGVHIKFKPCFRVFIIPGYLAPNEDYFGE
jgi:hypothetical protein